VSFFFFFYFLICQINSKQNIFPKSLSVFNVYIGKILLTMPVPVWLS